MGMTATRRAFEIRIRFEPGLGASLYASLREGESGRVAVARQLGRGKALLNFRGYTLLAQGVPDWSPATTLSVVVKELGPPLILASANGSPDRCERVQTIESSVVPSAAADFPGAAAR